MHASQPTPADNDTRLNVLIVDDDNTVRAALSKILNITGHQATTAHDGESALRCFDEARPDLVLLDVNMPTMNGFDVARRMRQRHGEDDWVPIIFLSGASDSSSIVEGINAGGDDYLLKPIKREVLIAKVYAMERIARMRQEMLAVRAQLEAANAKLKRLAMQDALTGVANRRFFDDYLLREWNRQLRHRRPLSLILIDVDHFKAYNDFYGHRQGDECLRRMARLLQRQLQRTTDLVARYGGEEFAVVLPEFPLQETRLFAEKLRRQVTAANLPHARNPDHACVTISLGVASLVPAGNYHRNYLIEMADRALYLAKDHGRNRVFSCSAANA